MNKKGNTLQIWIEIVLFLVLFLGIMTIIGANMNEQYGQNHDLTLGLNLSSQMTELDAYKQEMQNSTSSGTTSITDFGVLKLLTTPAILLTGVELTWNVLSGVFITNLIEQMNLGEYAYIFGIVFRALYVFAIGFILIKLVLRMNA